MNYKNKYLKIIKEYQQLSIIVTVYTFLIFMFIAFNMTVGIGIFSLMAFYIIYLESKIRKYLNNRAEIKKIEEVIYEES